MRSQLKEKDQNGMASIFVVLILMTLLALISIGFSRLMNREVRQSLDRELSQVAYYAAESGINDARAYLADGGGKIDGCPTPTGDPHFATNGDIAGNGVAKYTCVIVNPTPKELNFTLNPGESKVVKLTGSSLSTLSRLYFGWQNANISKLGPQPLGAYGDMPQQGAVGSDNTGLLRVGIYPTVSDCNATDSHGDRKSRFSAAADSTDAILECAARNYFMYPSSGPGGPPDCGYATLSNSNGCVRYINGTNANDDGGIVPGDCISPFQKPNTTFANQATPVYCNTVVSNLFPVGASAGPARAAAYYIRLTAVYQPINVFIEASDAPGGGLPANALNISDAQAIIDVTGTGNDVIRRIQTHAPTQQGVPPSNYGLQSMESVCKLFRNDVSGPGVYDNPHLDPAAGAFNTDNGGKNCSWPTGSNVINPGGIPPINIEPPPVISFWADSYSLSNGQSTTLRWSANADADTCTGIGFTTGGATSGSAGTGPLSSGSHTYSIVCTGPGGSTPASLTINVSSPNRCYIDNFTVDPSAVISWNWHCDDESDASKFGNISGIGVGEGGSAQLFGPKPPGTCFTLSVGTGSSGTTDVRTACVP